jgi:hypothetical protein
VRDRSAELFDEGRGGAGRDKAEDGARRCSQ